MGVLGHLRRLMLASSRETLLNCAIISVAFVVMSWRAQDPPLSQTALSRLATVVSLTEDGSWYIDRPPESRQNPFEARCIDKVEIDGRLLSSKPPLLPLMMTWEYRCIRAAFGWTLNNMEDTRRILYAFTLTFVVLPWTAALVASAIVLRHIVESRPGRLFALAALSFGSQVFGFASVFNNHVPAAAMLMLSACLLIGTSRRQVAVAAAAGFLGGLGASFDLPNAIYLIAFALYMMTTSTARTWMTFCAAAALPLLFQSYLLYRISGSPEPVQMEAGHYLFESSYWRNPLGIDAFEEPKGTYLYNLTLGSHGIFVLFPILVGGLAGTIMAIFRRIPNRTPILCGSVCFAIVLAYYTLTTSNYGGEAYGARWLIPSMPFLILMAAPVWERAARWPIFVVLAAGLAVSAYSAWECSVSPWQSGAEWINRILQR